MSRIVIGALGLVLTAASFTGLGMPASATGATTRQVGSAQVPAASASSFLKTPFARGNTVPGDRDSSPKSIDHVYELQYRLRWEGLFRYAANGVYGPRTTLAVKRFQKRVKLRQSGKAGHATWAKLIRTTVRAESSIPKRCKSSGWHACYDRKRHRVTLWRSGKLHNEWLVRGGAAKYKTRTGDFQVFRRSRNHVSNLYNSPMPYAQFFSGGQALHASYYMVNPFRGHSHGCINMYITDARQLWSITHTKRLRVHVYGSWS